MRRLIVHPMMQNEPKISTLALRFLLICSVLSLLIAFFGQFLLRLLVPIFRWEIALIAPSFNILQLHLAQHAGEAVFWLEVNIAQLLIVGGEFVVPNAAGSASASTIVGYVWQVLILFLSTLFSLPVRCSNVRYPNLRYLNVHYVTQYAYRLVVGLPLLLLLLMFDTPIALLGAIWGVIFQTLDPEKQSFLIEWNRFMVGGGRLVLSLTLAIFTVFLADKLSCQPTKSPV